MQTTVLIVDDERDIAALLHYAFTKEGYRAVVAADGRAAVDLARREKPDLVILDIMLPEMTGIEVLKVLRREEASREAPVILLTAKKDEADRVQGLELGADDYVTKPFSPRELLLRARALLRRRGREDSADGHTTLTVGPVEIEPEDFRVRVRGKSVPLTRTEFLLLADLVRARGRVRPREVLLDEVWGYSSDVLSRTIDTHVRRLRKKLGPAAGWLCTVRGVGYRFVNPEES